MLGTGATLRRETIPVNAPSKPPRTGSFRKHNVIDQDNKGGSEVLEKPSNDQQSEQSEPHNGDSTVVASEEAAVDVTMEAEKKGSPDQGGTKGDGVPVVKFSDSLGSLPRNSDTSKSQSSENSLPVVTESEPQDKVVGNGHGPSDKVHATKDHDDAKMEKQEKHSELQAAKEGPEPTKPTIATTVEKDVTSTAMENSTKKTTADQTNESDSNSTPKDSKSKSDTTSFEEQQSTRRSSFGTSKTFRAEDSLFETAQLLGKLVWQLQVFALNIHDSFHLFRSLNNVLQILLQCYSYTHTHKYPIS